MIDIIKANIFPYNVLAGVATGNLESKFSYFSTSKYSEDETIVPRINLENEYKDSFNTFYYQKQIHSDIILDLAKNENIKSDSVISNKRGTLLNISIADCQAVLICDPINNVVAAIHSGWKGTKLNIVNKTIKRLYNDYNSKPSELLVFLSPSASVQHYEVGKEFKNLFPNSTIRIIGKYYFNNRKEILKQLLDSGILIENIESSDECTITNNRLHSYRRDKEQSGRMSAFIGIRNIK